MANPWTGVPSQFQNVYGLFGMGDYNDWQDYYRKGGAYSYQTWKNLGKPTAPAQLSPYAASVYSRNNAPLPAGVNAPSLVTMPEGKQIADRDAQIIAAQLATPSPGVTPDYGTQYGLYDPARMPTQSPPTGYTWEWDDNTQQWQPKSSATPTQTKPPGAGNTYTDGNGTVYTWSDTNGYVQTGYDETKDTRLRPNPPTTSVKPSGFYTSYAEALAAAGNSGYTPVQTPDGWWGLEPPKTSTTSTPKIQGKSPYDNPATPEEEGIFNPNTGEWSPPYGWVDPRDATDAAYRKSQFDADETWRRQQADMENQRFQWEQGQATAQLEAQKQARLANLRANPASWLEYASLAGQTPTVQPWMVPLGQAGTGLRAGQALPGYNPQGNNMNLPQLTTPSNQYMNSIAPSSRQQYYGYQQAATGATPSDTQWLQWGGALPGGQYKGLSYGR